MLLEESVPVRRVESERGILIFYKALSPVLAILTPSFLSFSPSCETLSPLSTERTGRVT